MDVRHERHTTDQYSSIGALLQPLISEFCIAVLLRCLWLIHLTRPRSTVARDCVDDEAGSEASLCFA